jgi:hypothetical protein
MTVITFRLRRSGCRMTAEANAQIPASRQISTNSIASPDGA